jgi:signal transduction histidine kinase
LNRAVHLCQNMSRNSSVNIWEGPMNPAPSGHQPWLKVFNALSEAVCILDLEGRILNYNPALEALLEVPADQILGQKCCHLLHGVAEPIPDCPFTRLQESRRRETLTLSANGRTLQLTAEPLWDESGTLIGAVHIITDMSSQVRERTGLLKRIRELEEQCVQTSPHEIPLRRLCRKLIEDREAEGRRQQRILSDEVGKFLAGLKLELRSLGHHYDDPFLAGVLEKCLRAVDRIWDPVQDLISELRPPLLDDLGLVPALRWTIDLLEKRLGLPIQLHIDPDPVGLPSAIEDACFHLVRGALVLQSRQARSLTVSIQMVDGRLELLVGADAPDRGAVEFPDRGEREGDPAWLELQQRVLLLGGEALIRFAPGKGPEIRFQIPLSNRL